MRSGSIGTPGALSSSRGNRADKRSGFTLLEALVALALLLMFVTVLVPYLFHARRIMDHAENRMAAQILLRTLINAPYDRSHLANADRDGDLGGLHWHIVASPIVVDTASSDAAHKWMAYRIAATVSWGGGQRVAAQTVRIAKPQ